MTEKPKEGKKLHWTQRLKLEMAEVKTHNQHLRLLNSKLMEELRKYDSDVIIKFGSETTTAVQGGGYNESFGGGGGGDPPDDDDDDEDEPSEPDEPDHEPITMDDLDYAIKCFGDYAIKQFVVKRTWKLRRRNIYTQETFCEDKKRYKIVPFCIVKAPQSYTGSAPVTSEVLYIEKNRVFLRAVEGLVGERAYLVAQGDKCEFVWDPSHMPKGKGKGRRPDLKLAMQIADKTEPELTSKPMSFGIQMASQISFLKAGWHKKLRSTSRRMLGLSERPAGAPTGDTLVPGSAVKITGGNYKGLRGEIRDFLEDRVRISLLSAPKLVEVSINDVQDDLYSKDKASQKFVDFYTPREAPMPEKSEEQTLAEGLDRATMPSDEQAWDPKWLMGDDSAPITPAVSIVSSSRRRRAPRLARELLAETGPANGS
eukprot:s13_g12.t1